MTNSLLRPSVLLTIAAIGCGDSRIEREGQPDVIAVGAADAAMVAAIADARSSSTAFFERVSRPEASYSYAAVKVRLTDSAAVEHVWLSRPTAVGTNIFGILNNEPVQVRRHRVGDTISVHRDSITDWMLIDRDTVFGAFTVFVLRNQMTPDEQLEFDKQQAVYYGATPRRLSGTPKP